MHPNKIFEQVCTILDIALTFASIGYHLKLCLSNILDMLSLNLVRATESYKGLFIVIPANKHVRFSYISMLSFNNHDNCDTHNRQ